MAVTCARYEQYLDIGRRRRARTRPRPLGDGRSGPARPASPQVDIAKKNLAIIVQAPREGAGDPALPRRRPRPARPHRELVPADRRSDRDDAVAAGAVGPARRAAGRRRVHRAERGRHRAAAAARPGRSRAAHERHRASFPPGPTTSAAATCAAKPSMFVLHGNVYDVVVHGQQRLSALTSTSSPTCCSRTPRTTIAVYNVSTGVALRQARRRAGGRHSTTLLLRDAARSKVLAGARAAARRRRRARR